MLAAALFAAGAQADEPRCGTALASDVVIQRLNEVRAHSRRCGADAMAGGPTLIWNEALAGAARQQASEMAALRRMSHRDGKNRDLGERLKAQGYRYSSAVENVAVGYGSFDAVIEAWLESAGHCRNLMSGAVIEFGVACVDASGTGAPEEQRYWTLVLAAPLPARTPLDGRMAAHRDPPSPP